MMGSTLRVTFPRRHRCRFHFSLVAHELGFRYVDDEVVMRVSAEAGVSPDTTAQVEHSRALSERIVQAISTLSVETRTKFEGHHFDFVKRLGRGPEAQGSS